MLKINILKRHSGQVYGFVSNKVFFDNFYKYTRFFPATGKLFLRLFFSISEKDLTFIKNGKEIIKKRKIIKVTERYTGIPEIQQKIACSMLFRLLLIANKGFRDIYIEVQPNIILTIYFSHPTVFAYSDDTLYLKEANFHPIRGDKYLAEHIYIGQSLRVEAFISVEMSNAELQKYIKKYVFLDEKNMLTGIFIPIKEFRGGILHF